jgi:hypothetical protein
MDEQEKEPKLVTNRGFVVDLIFNFPQGTAVDKESYINDIIEHIHQAFNAGNTVGQPISNEDFLNWLKQPKK